MFDRAAGIIVWLSNPSSFSLTMLQLYGDVLSQPTRTVLIFCRYAVLSGIKHWL